MICVRCKKDVQDGPYCSQCGAKQEREKGVARRAQGTGTAIKRGHTWTGVATGYSYTERQEDGTLKRVRKRPRKGGFKTKRDALQWANSYTQDNTAAPTLAALWEGFKGAELEKLSKDKQTAYRLARKRLEPIIARPLDTLTIKDLQDCVDQNALTHYTARDCKTLLSKLYRRAMAEKTATVNLSQFIVLPELVEHEAEPFTTDEVSTMWAAYNAGNTFVGYILLLIYTGMMPAELKACRKEMIDREKCEIWGCGKKTKKRKKEIPIVYPDFLAPVLDALCAESKTDMLLDYGHNQFYDKYHLVLQSIGVRDLPPYSCRHTYGTEAVKGANSPEVVRQMLRHSTILMQQRYTHIGTEAAHKAANALRHEE